MTIEDLAAQSQWQHIEHKPYWDVFPKVVRVSVTEEVQVIPLSIRGDAPSPLIESTNEDVAEWSKHWLPEPEYEGSIPSILSNKCR